MGLLIKRLASLILMAVGAPSSVPAATTNRLPDWVCAHPDAIFVDAFEGVSSVVRTPSNGSGGAAGTFTRSVFVNGASRNIYVFVPASYTPDRPMPLVLALHGQAGNPSSAQTSAQNVRTAWSPIATDNGFIVIAPVATGASGGWSAPDLPPFPPGPSDYDTFAAAIADIEGAYNIDRSRRIGWGFSAGGHVMHDVVLQGYALPISIDTFAAYGVSAGVLEAFACAPSTCGSLLAAASRKIPVDIHVGSSDTLLSYAQNDRSRFIANGWQLSNNLWFTTFSGGHTYATAQLREIWTNLCPFQVLP
jgi:poly(3-hydroxybutyrate) depolymerase